MTRQTISSNGFFASFPVPCCPATRATVLIMDKTGHYCRLNGGPRDAAGCLIHCAPDPRLPNVCPGAKSSEDARFVSFSLPVQLSHSPHGALDPSGICVSCLQQGTAAGGGTPCLYPGPERLRLR